MSYVPFESSVGILYQENHLNNMLSLQLLTVSVFLISREVGYAEHAALAAPTSSTAECALSMPELSGTTTMMVFHV